MRAIPGSFPIVLCGLFLFTPAGAQDDASVASLILDDPSDVMAERFGDGVPVAGSPLVGVRLGTVQGNLSVDDVYVAQPPDAGSIICVRTATEDGRYAAQNRYRAGSGPSAPPAARLYPVTQRYGSQLATYQWDQFAVRAFVSRDGKCLPAEALHLPQMTSDSDRSGDLVVSLNARSRSAKASVYSESSSSASDAPVVRSTCKSRAETARLAFDTECHLEIPDKVRGQTVRLRVEFDDGFTVEPQDYNVYLPRPVAR